MDAERPTPAPALAWDAWGSDGPPSRLPSAAGPLLDMFLQGRRRPIPRRDRGSVVLTPSRLDASTSARFAAITEVTADDAVRVRHLGGKSTPDLLRRREPEVQLAPDAVVLPGDHDETQAVLEVAAELDVAVVPFGGGTSVVGGVSPDAGAHASVIALDLRRTAALLDLDEVSLLATFGAGTTGPQAEELLAHHGLTLGHFPQSFEFATIGGFAATRSSGQASSGYGRFDALVHALRVATPRGALRIGVAPASAAGPDLRQLFLGSEGAFGVITEVTVRVRRRPETTEYAAWTFPDFARGAAALRELTQSGVHPTVIRLSDELETRVNGAMAKAVTTSTGCLAIGTFEGAPAEARRLVAATDAVFARHGAKARGPKRAMQWEHGRFHAPSQRDALLDIGVLAETLETATTWSRLAELKAAVTSALTDSLAAAGSRPLIMAHISHVYPAGASLYFTVIAILPADPAARWTAAKAAASDAIVAAGGTITHHHAVGVDHRPWLASEIGELGVEVLRAVKTALDPTGIMHPGTLVAE